ncbi:spherulin-2A-like [Leguminivora glycinivorella]|uniref:spherulin-2A-like n=1 Tax=Leguminivora glycinivorella TaxID=1035111 RepID=UPI00200F00E8|nr:spherulin-2A-like [Leguminivora glycinivorella]
MAFRFLFLVLPVLVHARINVEIDGKFQNENSDMKVHFSGSQMDTISDQERASFSLEDNNLKNAVNAYFGKRPDDAYLRSPTPWGDLYRTYNWQQVARTLIPKSSKVLKIKSQPLIVMQQVFENNSTMPATFNVGISHSVENRVSSHWTKSGELSLTQEISYGIDIEVANFGGSTSFSYTSGWGIGAEKSETVTIGATSSMNVLLQPGQSVTTELLATKGTIQIEVEYMASLSGAVAVNYDKVYKGHHYWALPIEAVMSQGGLKNEIMSKEIIEIDFYSQSKVIVHDRNTRAKMLDVAF